MPTSVWWRLITAAGVAFRFADVGALLYQLHYDTLPGDNPNSSRSCSGVADTGNKASAAAAAGFTAASVKLPQTQQQQQQQGMVRSISDSASIVDRPHSRQQQQQDQQAAYGITHRAASAPVATAAAAAAAAAADLEDIAVAREPKAPKRIAKSLAFLKAKKLETHTRAAALIRRAEAASASSVAGSSITSSAVQDAQPASRSRDQGVQAQQQQHEANAIASTSTPTSSRQTASGSAHAAADANAAASKASTSAAAAAARQAKHPPVAEQLSLRQSWRTQRRILAVANAITDVLYHLFPGTVDKLPPERSEVSGAVPVLLEPGCSNDPLKLVFGAHSDQYATTISSSGSSSSSGGGSGYVGSSSSRVAASMNAKTAVLVRDEAAAAPVRRLVGDGALVLTVAEAKGLEYQVRASLLLAKDWL
jgi:hypothetical protein